MGVESGLRRSGREGLAGPAENSWIFLGAPFHARTGRDCVPARSKSQLSADNYRLSTLLHFSQMRGGAVGVFRACLRMSGFAMLHRFRQMLHAFE